MSRARLAVLCLLVTTFFMAPHALGFTDESEVIKVLPARFASSIVTVKYVASEELRGRAQKNEIEVPGVLLSADGLVLVANSQLQGILARSFSQLGSLVGMSSSQRPDAQLEIESVSVILESESRELGAKLIAQDSDLDLAWVQIVEAEEHQFSSIDLNDYAELDVGDQYFAISRMPKRFDRVPVVTSYKVAGKVDYPRPLLVSISPHVGLVFSSDAKVAGFMVTQEPEDGAASPTSLDLSVRSSALKFILPVPTLVDAMKQVREIAPAGEE